MTFKDHFSRRAATYARYRPSYPDALFAWIAGHAPSRRLAWDCATGNGQAARGLAEWFARVVATDASGEQIAQAPPDERIDYRVAPADASGLPDESADVVTVAQALHWFDRVAFYAEARRVLVPHGLLAVWTYGDPMLDDPALDAMLHRFNKVTVGGYWPPERGLLDDGYRSLDFPFREIDAPSFTLEREWTLAELAGYLRSWSATARFVERQGRDPVDDIERELGAHWPADIRRTVRWPLSMRAGHR
jgi:SAM-dependent methyltransferase